MPSGEALRCSTLWWGKSVVEKRFPSTNSTEDAMGPIDVPSAHSKLNVPLGPENPILTGPPPAGFCSCAAQKKGAMSSENNRRTVPPRLRVFILEGHLSAKVYFDAHFMKHCGFDG